MWKMVLFLWLVEIRASVLTQLFDSGWLSLEGLLVRNWVGLLLSSEFENSSVFSGFVTS